MLIKSSVLKNKPKNYNGMWLSVSKVKTFKTCKAQYRYVYIEKRPRKEWPHHIFGSFAHEVVENFHRKIIEGYKGSLNDLMTECFKISCVTFSGKMDNEQKREVWGLLNDYLINYSNEEKTGKAPEVVDVEKKFYIDIDGKVLLNGFIDRIQNDDDNIIHVADYKTTKNKKYLIGDYLQLLTYAYAICMMDPDIQKVRASYILMRHKFGTIMKEYSREEVMSVEKQFLKFADEIRAEKLWRPSTSPLCRFCDHADVCEAGQEIVEKSKGDVSKFGATSW